MPKQTNKVAVVIATMVGIFLSALDISIVGTVTPTVVGTLGGISLYAWVFTAYLLTSTTTMPIYGKLADLYGRKPVLLFGTGVFLLGSALCGASQSMEQLIFFRALQGLGAGAVAPITITIVGDIFSLEERARIQGIYSSLWGVAAVVGPAAGALIVSTLGWRWAFLVNLPIGIVSMIILWVSLHENVERKRHRIDYLGTLTLSAGVIALLMGLNWGGETHDWLAPAVVTSFILSACFIAWFLWTEMHAMEPMLPLSLFRNRIISASSGAGFMAGVAQYGAVSFLPLFAQGALGGDALSAGMIVAPISVGWLFGSLGGGRLLLRMGYRVTASSGLLLILVGSVLFFTLTSTDTLTWPMAITTVLGIGLGFANIAMVLSVQNAVSWHQRGIATASTQFFRTIGGSIGVALMGTLLANSMHDRLTDLAGRFRQIDVSQLGNVNILLDVAGRASLPPSLLTALRDALAISLHPVYVVMVAGTVLGLFAAGFLPGGRPQQHAVEAQAEA